MKYKVVFLKPLHESGQKLLEENDCEVFISKGTTEDEFIADVEDADAIFVRNEKITAHLIDSAPKLKVIAKHGAGYDNIDVEHATGKGIQVVYVPNGNAVSVAEHTIMMILCCARRLNYVQNQFRSGNYGIRYTLEEAHDVEGKVLGILGCGNIGRKVALKASVGFGMKVIGYSEHTTQQELEAQGIPIELVKNRNEIFERSDFISLHLPATPQNIGCITLKELKLMQKKSYLINTSRGNIVNEADLVKALQEGEIMGAGLDVFEQEPTDSSNPLLNMEQVIITPHCAGMTVEASERLSRLGAMGIVESLYGRDITYPVNKISRIG